MCLRDLTQRKCPGIYLAHSVLDLATVRLLWAFNFNKPRDPSGKSIDVDIWNDKPVRARSNLFVQLTEVLPIRVFWVLPFHSVVTSAYGLLSTLKLSVTATRTQLQYLNLLSRSYAKLIENGWLPPELTKFYVGLPVSYVPKPCMPITF